MSTKDDWFKRDLLDALHVINNNFRDISQFVTKKPGKTFDRYFKTEKETEDLFKQKVLECLACMTYNLANINDFLREKRDN